MLKESTEHHQVFIEDAYANLILLLDLDKADISSNDIIKIGAFFQNLALVAHNYGIGLIWVDDVINNQEEILNIFRFSSEKYQLLCITARGNIGNWLRMIKLKNH